MFWPFKMSHSFIQNRLLLYNCKFHSIKDEQLDIITSLILLMRTMLPCLISSKQTVSSNQCLCCYTGLKVIVAEDKTPKRGCRWPAVDNGVPIEGVEFIYHGNKQSSNDYCRPDVLRRIGLACSVMNSLYRWYGIAVLSVSAPKYTCTKSTDKFSSALWYRNTDRPSWSPTWIQWRLSIWGVSDRYLMYAGGLMSPMQRCLSDLVTSYVIDAYLCMATLHAWTLEYDALRLMNDTCEGRKAMASWRRPPGLPRNVWLNKVKEDATLYCYLRCGDLRSPWVTEPRKDSLGLSDDDDGDDDEGTEGCKTCVKNGG